MAEGLLKSWDSSLEVYSAGTQPAERIHPKAVQVLYEVGIDISSGYPKNVSRFLDQSFDYVITVCDDAKETCPVFTVKVKHRLHIGFEDPAEATGTDEELLSVFRCVRDEMEDKHRKFYNKLIKNKGE